MIICIRKEYLKQYKCLQITFIRKGHSFIIYLSAKISKNNYTKIVNINVQMNVIL